MSDGEERPKFLRGTGDVIDVDALGMFVESTCAELDDLHDKCDTAAKEIAINAELTTEVIAELRAQLEANQRKVDELSNRCDRMDAEINDLRVRSTLPRVIN